MSSVSREFRSGRQGCAVIVLLLVIGGLVLWLTR
jgi:MFS-type transporter involved in bile tolerance (Atg22 family)